MRYRKASDFYLMSSGGEFVAFNRVGLRVDFDTLVFGRDSLSLICRSAVFGFQRVLCRRELRGSNSYWYAFAVVGGRLRKIYIGKDLGGPAVFDAAFRFYEMNNRKGA